MTGNIRLFERLPDGRLAEVDPSDADELRASRRTSHVVMAIDVLWTDEEEAQADAELAAQNEAEAKASEAREAQTQLRAEIAGRIGITVDELEALFNR